MASPTSGYCFADFELDLVRGCLMCAGKERPLRYQSFQLLRYFVERPGMLISKEELTAAIWADTSVTDNALVQCVAEIRKELNDDSHNPQFIRTIPKLGYRFIAEVEFFCGQPAKLGLKSQSSSPRPITGDSHGDAFLKLKQPPNSQLASIPNRLSRLRWLIPLGIAALLLFGLHSDTAPLEEPDGVTSSISGPSVLAVFPLRNETGRQDLDWLRDGVSDMILTDLAHTREWNVLSREKMHTLLDDGASPGTSSFQAMFQAAKSVHAKDFVAGTVTMTGQQATIRVDTHDGADGHLVVTDSISLNDPREIVSVADLLASDISRHLGFRTGGTPFLGDVMTNNVEAYRYYSLGVEKAEQFQNSQAIESFKKAIGLDPKFAMAYARIGYAYAVQDFQPENARPYLERALHFSEQLPAINRLYIEAWSAIAHLDYNAAIGILREITNQYPNETEAYCQLSRILRGQERVDEAAELLREAIQNNPDSKDLYNAYGLILIAQGRPAEAIGAYKQYVAMAPQNPNAHDSLGMSYQLAGQYEASLSEYNEALQLDPEFEPSIVHVGDVFFQEGRYHEALSQYRRYIQVANSSDAKAIGYGDLSTVYRVMGNFRDAQAAAAEEVRYNSDAVWDSLVIALDQNQRSSARTLEARLFSHLPNPERGSPRDLRTEFFYRGYIELETGDTQGALSNFKLALQHLPPSSGIDLHEDCLANAYLQLHMIPDAIAEYTRILKLNPSYPRAYYHLGLAYQELHQQADAAPAFRQFLRTSPFADKDSLEMLEAKRSLGPTPFAGTASFPKSN
jgi:tetratricopeptide (TPR) repeat protein/DNA-binding winged helix-turn-helix (wHTH) protein